MEPNLWSAKVVSLPVYPRGAADLPATELADFVVAAIPAQGFEHLGWDYMIDSPMIRWTTDGVDWDESNREGLARITVAGQPATRIRQQREELAWTITLGTDGPSKFGPKWIRIEGGLAPTKTHSNELCFGTLDEGCNFTATQALNSVQLARKDLCKLTRLGGTREVYQISAARKMPAMLIWETSGGSGGTSSSLEIRPMSDQLKACGSSD